MPYSIEKFKPGEVVVCIDITNKPFQGKKIKNVKTITKYNNYVVQEKSNPYNEGVFIINDQGLKKSFSAKRFVSINKFRNPKIKKIIRKINIQKNGI